MSFDEKNPFKVFNHGKEKISIDIDKMPVIMRPTELHFKEDGSLKNEPSFAFVMERPSPIDVIGFQCVVGEISLEMLNEGLKKLGYHITPTPK